MAERQRQDDPVRRHLAPALGEVPEREQQPVLDALVVGDRERDREVVRAPRAAVEELDAELRPGLMRVTSAWSSTASRVGSSTSQPTSAWTCEPASSQTTAASRRTADQLDAAAPEHVDLA